MEVALTQSNLLRLKEELEIAREGHDLLDEKREVMVMELMDNIHRFKELEDEITEKLRESYSSLEKAWVTMGKDKIEEYSEGEKEYSLDTRMRSVMGVSVPEFLIDTPEVEPEASMDGTDKNFDEALINFRNILETLVNWAAREALIWRLGSEINRTQKRVNALENISIPDYEKKIKKIEESLEEEEREEFFRRKMLKEGEF